MIACHSSLSLQNVIKTAGHWKTDCKPDSYEKYKFQAKEIKDVMKQWNERMAVLQEQGYSEKKLSMPKKESNKLKDLTYLKSHISPGPFSKADEVHSNRRKWKERLYVEVQCARVSSSTFKETASIFCLKQTGRNLTTQEYANNLIKYMDDTESMNTLALADLNTVLAQMVDNDGNCETEEPCEDEVIINTINTLYNFCCHFYHICKNNCYSLPFSIYLYYYSSSRKIWFDILKFKNFCCTFSSWFCFSSHGLRQWFSHLFFFNLKNTFISTHSFL